MAFGHIAVALTTATCVVLTLGIASQADAASATISRSERTLIRLVNETRVRHALPRLRVSCQLTRAADGHSLDMLSHDFFEHESSDGTSFARRLRRYVHARSVGEDLALVFRASRFAREVLTMWLESPSHRAVVLSPRYRRSGVATRTGRQRQSSDCVLCATGRYGFRTDTTPLVDLARASWACWPGHFGQATAPAARQCAANPNRIPPLGQARTRRRARSPLRQTENADVCQRGPLAAEIAHPLR